MALLAKTELASLVWAPPSACFPGAPAVIWSAWACLLLTPVVCQSRFKEDVGGRKWPFACTYQASRVRSQRRRAGSLPTTPGAGAGFAQPATQRLPARDRLARGGHRRSRREHPGSIILAPAGCGWWGGGQATKEPPNRRHVFVRRKFDPGATMGWASAFLPVSTGILHLPESLSSRRPGPTHLVAGSPADTVIPGAPPLDTSQCTQTWCSFQAPHLLQPAPCRGGALSSSNTKTYFSTDSVCAKELWRLTTAYKDTHPHAAGEI